MASISASQANGAQIPLDSFQIPQFPREAGGLMALTLTNAIPSTSAYEELLTQPHKVTHLPPSIQSLTLEHFTHGYPPGFLADLIGELPELRSLVLYAQAFGGTSAESAADALAFFEGAKKLRALHLLDATVPAGFLEKVAPLLRSLERALMFLELSWTDSVGERAVVEKVPTADLPVLIMPGLVSLTLNMSAAEEGMASMGSAAMPVESERGGIRIAPQQNSELLVKALLDDDTAPKAMKGLNVTLYQLTTTQLMRILARHKGLMVISVSIEIESSDTWWHRLSVALAAAENLEQAEIVLCPAQTVPKIDFSLLETGLKSLSAKATKLADVKFNQRRSGRKPSAICTKMGGSNWRVKLDSTGGE